MVPARHTREVVIKTKGGAPPQSPAEVVSKVNTALHSSDALAVRRLQSGDIVVSFKNEVGARARDESWVKAAFGDQATLARRTYAVLAKGIPRSLIEKRAEEEIKADIERVNEIEVARCRRRIPKSKEAKYGMLLIETESVAAAQEICSRGVVLEAQMFTCEPYSGELQVQQCFNCYAYGHLAKVCTRKAKCGYCSNESHIGGDRNCPERTGGAPKCINCKGRHTAWDRSCHGALAERQRIKDAYIHRPRQFVVGGSEMSWTSRSGSSAPTSSRSSAPVSGTPEQRTSAGANQARIDAEGYQLATSKKRKTAPRGRPRDLDRPEPGNRRVDEVFASQGSARSQRIAASTQGEEIQTTGPTDTSAW